MSFSTIVSMFAADLTEVKSILHKTLAESEYGITKSLSDYTLAAQGKFIRPVLTLLAFYSVNQNPSQIELKNVYKIAAAIEIIHIASLVHDDVIDDGEYRRSQPTINKKWGMPTAVAYGVYLYSSALTLIAEVGSPEILSNLAYTVKSMSEGELHEIDQRDVELFNSQSYYSTINAKTSDLFVSATYCGSTIAGATDSQLSQMALFSKQLGQLFQISDDFLDIVDTNGDLKKEVGQDLQQGTVTLPIQLLLNQLSDEDKHKVLTESSDVSSVIQTILNDKHIADTFYQDMDNLLSKHARDAHACLVDFEQSHYLQALCDLIDLIQQRAKLTTV
ncbi:hypothetical protein DID76_04420 [Candidatus Marinamargulisbacteria bacterium SCGC AG-414-C22]|nr:hypothetical protein DID76_04420 [Candidatus Marinamargulisbacteria bacterium SCGC AG-414-C22]